MMHSDTARKARMQAPQVTHVLDDFAIGGAQRMLMRFLANSSAEESSVIAMSRKDTRWDKDIETSAIPYRVLQSSRLSSLRTWASAMSALRASPSSIVHVHMQYASIVFLPLSKLLGRKTVVTLHNVTEEASGWRRRVRFALECSMIRRFADSIISVGPLVTEVWRKHLPKCEILTIPNAIPIPEEITTSARTELRRKLDVPDGAIVVIAVASLTTKKNLSQLIDAFAEVRKQSCDALLWIAGSGPEQERLIAQVRQLGISDSATFLGARTDVDNLLVASDIFALSSRIEGLPIAMLEAMARELPVVVPDVGDIRTVVDNKNGILVPPGDTERLADALERLVLDNELRRELGKAARNKVARDHSETRWLAQMRDFYRDVDKGN